MSARPRPAVLLLGVALGGAGCVGSCAYPQALSGRIVTQDRRAGVPCRLALWRDEIRILDGAGTPLATAVVRTGEDFEAPLDVTAARKPPPVLWVSIVCDGYFHRIRGFDWRPMSAVLSPMVDLGTVWVPVDAAAARRDAAPDRRP